MIINNLEKKFFVINNFQLQNEYFNKIYASNSVINLYAFLEETKKSITVTFESFKGDILISSNGNTANIKLDTKLLFVFDLNLPLSLSIIERG